MALLEVEELSTGYGSLKVLWDVSIRLREGEIVALIGPNGAGKSTLLKCIAGVIKPLKGRIKFNGSDITNLPPYKIVEKGIVYVPDASGILPKMSVYENLLLGAYGKQARNLINEKIAMVYEIFPILKERSNQLVGTMSGGERQMLCIARALMSSPKILLLDEPSTGLSPIAVLKVYETIKSLQQNMSLSIFLVEQDVVRGLSIANRGYLLETGRVVLSGSADSLLSDIRVKTAYLGI